MKCQVITADSFPGGANKIHQLRKIVLTLILTAVVAIVYAQDSIHFTRPGDYYAILLEYTGDVKDGKANGYGEAKGRDIGYKGYWKDNDFNGKGILSDKSGVKYEGEFLNGKMHGKGTRNYFVGCTYTGSFVDGKQTGWGKATYPDSTVKEGYFVEDQFKGTVMTPELALALLPKESLFFRMTNANNPALYASYKGEVKNGQANGYGEAVVTWQDSYADDKTFETYKGYWKDNMYYGKGTLAKKGGSTYEGDFMYGRPHGKGVYTYEGGGNYTGDFVNGQRQGKGVMTYSSGSKEDGEWGSDQFRGDGKTLPSKYFRVRTPEEIAAEETAKQAVITKEKDALQAQLTKEKDAKDPCKMGWGVYGYERGNTRNYQGQYVILSEFDCKKDVYKLYRPAQQHWISKEKFETGYYDAPGAAFRAYSNLPDKHFATCRKCEGDGSEEVTIYTTKTKELPWGYFSGIQTTSTKTTSKTHTQTCKVCDGAGVLLR
ncbi:MAG: hypothetical protein V4722_24340 [Bacteroidota bacterium]